MTTMRAKLTVSAVIRYEQSEGLTMVAKYTGSAEDHTYSKATPSAELKLNITNPDLIGKFNPGDVFYVDFTPA